MQNPQMNSHLDPQFEDRILHEVKSQGVFDEFRKDSMADVDTKPAYQNLRQRVENTVKKFLSEQHWSPDMNKNQLRERLRRHITEAGFLDVGVERIVDQVVNPKISTVFQPRIEEITYKYLGLPPPPKHEPPPPIMHPLPPLPLTGKPLEVDTSSLLPTGLEQISPDSDKATVKSENREDDPSVQDMDIDTDEKMVDDDDESPPFEPLIKREKIKHEEDVDTKPSSSTPKKEVFVGGTPPKLETFMKKEVKKYEMHENSMSATTSALERTKSQHFSLEADALLSQDSQLSQVSSDSRISDVTANASHSFMDDSSPHIAPETISDPTETAMELASVNISEEAQMPKFNENTSDVVGAKSNSTELHFDIKKDEIKFEGTGRKSTDIAAAKSEKSGRHFNIKHDEIKFEGTGRKSDVLNQGRESNSLIENGNSPDENLSLSGNSQNKEAPHHFSNLTIDTGAEHVPTRLALTSSAAVTPTQTPHDSSFGSSLEDISNQTYLEHSKNGIKNHTINAADPVFSTPIYSLSDRKETSTTENRGSSSSSSRHKKHSKDKRRPHESKEKHRDKEKSKKRSKSKDKDKYKDREVDKDRSRDKSRHKSSKERHHHKERKEKDRSKDKERSHREHKHSRSKHESHDRSSSSKRSSSLNTGRDVSNSRYEKSGTSKHSASLASFSSSSSRSESHHEARREKHDKRETDKKSHRSSSSNSSSMKKADKKAEKSNTEIPVDDHNIEKMKTIKRRSSDSNDEDKGGGGGGSGRNAREMESLSSNGTTFDRQQDHQREIKNASPSTQSPKGQTKNNVREGGYKEDSSQVLSMVDKTCNTAGAQQLTIQSHRNQVVILSDMLENPNINFIDLGPTKTSYSLNSDIPKTSTTHNTSPEKHIPESKNEPSLPAHEETTHIIEKDQLLFFEAVNSQFTQRLRLLDNAMDGCRRVVNNLRFDCVNEFCEDFETNSNGESENNFRTTTCATLTIDCVPAYRMDDCFSQNEKSRINSLEKNVNCNGLTEKRKRNSNGQLIYSTPSPTLSDASVSSKENVALDKNADKHTI